MNTQEITETPRSVLEQFGSILWQYLCFLLGFIAFAIGSVLEDIIRHPDDYSEVEKKVTGEPEKDEVFHQDNNNNVGVKETEVRLLLDSFFLLFLIFFFSSFLLSVL